VHSSPVFFVLSSVVAGAGPRLMVERKSAVDEPELIEVRSASGG
jgi:hypothetical protein